MYTFQLFINIVVITNTAVQKVYAVKMVKIVCFIKAPLDFINHSDTATHGNHHNNVAIKMDFMNLYNHTIYT